MTRIIAGLAGGTRLQVPKSGTRPTSDRVREAMFSALDSRDAITGTRVADLYAGSGALGLEAASRGAASVVLVEKSPTAAKIVRANAAAVSHAGARSELRVVARDVSQWLAGAMGPFDLVFVDPPYEVESVALATVLDALPPLLAPGAVVMVERSSRNPEPRWPAGLIRDRQNDYGETRLYWLTRVDAAQPPAPSQPA